MSLDIVQIPADPSNYTRNRAAQGGRVTHATVHHAAGTSLQGVDNTFRTPGRSASTHYGVQDGQVHQYLPETDVPWSDGSWASNISTVSMELVDAGGAPDWPVSEATFDTAAQLVADILKRHGLGPAVKGVNVCWHQMYSATACPGPWMLRNMDRFVALVNKYMEVPVTKEKKVQMYAYNGTDAQMWRPVLVAENAYTLESKAKPGYFLGVAGGAHRAGVLIQAQPRMANAARQQFKLVHYADRKYVPAWAAPLQIVPCTGNGKGLRLDVKAASKDDGAALQLYAANATAAQKFVIYDHGDGYWSLACIGTGTVVDLAAGGR
ncbi:MAG: RICIN domain-containing protein [Coriobacteriales bacterium]|jgi:N-acetylmuramoyl-L-alanine amidase CwlA|nr:RICIN domain-containing protein [Coriobacteriales bacterium]